MNKTIKTSLLAATVLFAFAGCDAQNYQQIDAPAPVKKVKKVSTAKVELTQFSVSKPLLFRPINKNNKSVYFSLMDQTIENTDGLKKNMIKYFKSMGYKVLTNPSKATFIVTIYATDIMTNKSYNSTTKNYTLNVLLEQRIKGKTTLTENHTINSSVAGASERTKTANTTARPTYNNYNKYSKFNKYGMNSFNKFYKPQPTVAPVKATIKEEVASNKAANQRIIDSNTTLDYYWFNEEVKVDASFKITGMKNQIDNANKTVEDKLAYKLVKLFDI